MAHAEIALSVRSAILTDDSDGSRIPEIVRQVTADASDPQLAQFVARFDEAVVEQLFWQFRLPGSYRQVQESGYPRLHVQFFMDEDQTDDEQAVCFQAAVVAIGPRGAGGSPEGDSDAMTSLSLGGGGWASGSVTLDHADPATGGRLYQTHCDLGAIMDGSSAGDYIILGLRRDAENVSLDTATGDACVVAVSLEYSVG
jgi:hypothetical protein